MLKDPFPSQQQLIDHKFLNETSSSTDEVRMMSSKTVNLNTRSHNYDPPPKNKPDDVPSEKPSTSTPPNNGLHIEKSILEAIFLLPKGTLRKSIINPNARATQYYNIVEYLAQAPFAMPDLEVLETCPQLNRNIFLRSLELWIPRIVISSLSNWMISR